MRKILFIMTLILPLLISNTSWSSNLPVCEGSPLSASNWQDSYEWDNCQGTVSFTDDSKYVGEWKDGSEHGQGTYTWVAGDQYVGEHKKGMAHGQGTYTFANDDQYVGEFKDGLYHGQGTLTYADGSKDEGIWKEDEFLYENIVSTNEDEEFCLEIGFKIYTPEYDNCVQKTAEKD
jgi:hypothetical protein